MKIGSVDLQKRVFVVAEIGNNYEGSYTLAEQMIGLAADAGVDAVKFQTFIPEHYVSCDQTERLQRLRRFALTVEQFRRLGDLIGSADAHWLLAWIAVDKGRLDLCDAELEAAEADALAGGDMVRAGIAQAAVARWAGS